MRAHILFLIFAGFLTACASKEDVAINKTQQYQDQQDQFTMLDAQAARSRGIDR